jgi:RNA polymerase sigma-70 factor (ECF subfamily)
MDGAPNLSLEELLAHAGWVRRLAGALVGDPSAADDLVQDTWHAALRRPPPADIPTRPWLARIVRNLARNRWRGEERRRERESEAARIADIARAGDSSAELEMHRALVEALMQIEEPFRGTILSRYFRGGSSAEIAQSERITESAVRHRLKRGLEMLRAKLDRRYGDRSVWCAVLLPIAGRSAPHTASVSAATVSVIAGGIAMSMTIKTLAAIGVVVAAALWFWSEHESNAPLSSAASTAIDAARPEAAGLEPRGESDVAKLAPSAIGRVLAAGVHEEATLEVLVVDERGRAPIAGVHLIALYADASDVPEPSLVATERRDLGLDRTTNSEGRAVFSVPARRKIVLADWHESIEAGSGHDLEGLAPGEHRTVVVERKLSELVPFFGRVFSRADRRPIAGILARIEAVPRWTNSTSTSRHHIENLSAADNARKTTEPSMTELQKRFGIWNRSYDQRLTEPTDNEIGSATSDAQGNFELKTWRWRQSKVYVRVSAPGYSPAIVFLAHPTSATEPLEILLDRAASIEARVVDANNSPLADAWIDLSAPWKAWLQPQDDVAARGQPYPHPEWSARTGADGTCALEELPPDVPLHGHVSRSGWIAEKPIDSFMLKPGERRELELSLVAGCTLTGRVVDESGQAATGVDLWLKRTRGTGAYPFQAAEQSTVNGSTRSDEAGNFRFDAVAAGQWRLGPANTSSPGDARYAPSVDVVEIAESAVTAVHEVVVHPALYITGTVIDSAGGIVDFEKTRMLPTVTAMQEDGSHILIVCRNQSEPSGSFKVAPVSAGAYDLRADCPGSYSASETQHVKAGETNIVLRLRENAILSGSVVDASSGVRAHAHVSAREDCKDWSLLTNNLESDDTVFRFGCLRPGRYEVVARTDDGRIGMASGVTVRSGETTDGVVVPVARGGKLLLTYIGSGPDAHYTLKQGTTVLAESYLRRGIQKTELLPSGRSSIRFTWIESAREFEREFELSAGEEKALAISDDG